MSEHWQMRKRIRQRFRWFMYRVLWRAGLKGWSLYFLIDRSPLSAAQVEYGQRLAQQLEREAAGKTVEEASDE